MTAACSQGAGPPLPVCRAPCDTRHAGVHTLQAIGMCTCAQTHTCSRRATHKGRPHGECLSSSCASSCESRRDPDTRVDVRFSAAPPILAMAFAAPSPAPGRRQTLWRDESLPLRETQPGSLGRHVHGAVHEGCLCALRCLGLQGSRQAHLREGTQRPLPFSSRETKHRRTLYVNGGR